MLFSALLLLLQLAPVPLTGTVMDQTGAPIAGATVVLATSIGEPQQTVSGPDGRFAFSRPLSESGVLTVRAGGFAVAEALVTASDVDIVLVPAGLLETVVVTPARSERASGSNAASIHVLDRDEIRQSPAVVADDVLRRIPTFSLFRRTSSLSSHPTAQGVSLRGIGPSGVSRTLVLVDGVPFNDPFGGWVYWTRVPLGSVERIEVVDGPSSSVYGNYAMGGVVNVISSRPLPGTIELGTRYGNLNSPKVDVFAGDVWARVGVVVEASGFRTSGFPIVIGDERGVIDNDAWVRFGNVNGRADYRVTDQISASFGGGYFTERRSNGKITEGNDTTWKHLQGGVRALTSGGSELQARVFADATTFNSTFVAVPATTPARNVVRLTLEQRVPTRGIGGSVLWSRAIRRSHAVSAGADWRWMDGDSREDAYSQAGAIISPVTGAVLALERVSGGTQRSVGAFVQDAFSVGNALSVTATARVDRWRNYHGHNLETNRPSGTPGAGHRPALADKEDTVVSPQLAAVYRLNDSVRVWGSLSAGFRAPTLNELYRQFAVGAIRTLANEQLSPERLRGGEVGVTLALRSAVVVRGTFYDNRLKDPVANVTIGANLQQRQNLGRTRVRGLQTDIEAALGPYLKVSGGYVINDARVAEYPANVQLVGKYLPQVPKHRASAQLAYSHPRFVNVAFATQLFGRQFDDDLNVRQVPGERTPGLPGYAVIDLVVSRSVTDSVELFANAQNLLDREYIVSTAPTTVGSPRLISAGVRVRFSGR